MSEHEVKIPKGRVDPHQVLVEVRALAASFSLFGSLHALQRITESGVYTPTEGTNKALVVTLGGGGAGGGTVNVVSHKAFGSGGAGAETRVGLYTVDDTQTGTVVVGAGGTGIAGDNGNPGQDTTFTFEGVTMTSQGGGGGDRGLEISGENFGGRTPPTGDSTDGPANAFTIQGKAGGRADYGTDPGKGAAGDGGDSALGRGIIGHSVNVTADGEGGNALPNSGAGGSGAFANASVGTLPGGNGGSGVVLVFEFK